MYFPYLYGRGAELGAIASSSVRFGAPQGIVPVIEPVLKPGGEVDAYSRKFLRTLGKLKEVRARVYVVTNPDLGGFADMGAVRSWFAHCGVALRDKSRVVPTLKISSSVDLSCLRSFVSSHHPGPVGILYESDAAVQAVDLANELGKHAGFSFRVFAPGKSVHGVLSSFFASNDLICIEEFFVPQSRNADYPATDLYADVATPLKSGHLGDYTVLPPEVNFGGGKAGAVVVHISVDLGSGIINVDHFVSDETDRNKGDFQSKLSEAIHHLSVAINSDPSRFFRSNAINNYLSQARTGKYTSPAMNKQLSIQHHLELMAKVLGI